MKTILLNASPRKDWNTAQMLKAAEEGAKAAGAETEYIDLYDLNFTGCRSCLKCKLKDINRNKCYWEDDLSPLIERILDADALIIGTPIYVGEPTAHFRALFERLAFCCLSYDDFSSYFKGKVNVGMIYTMGAPRDAYETQIRPALQNPEMYLGLMLNGKVLSYAACETLQIDDYSLYSMAMYDENKLKAIHETQWPKDLEAAHKLGADITTA